MSNVKIAPLKLKEIIILNKQLLNNELKYNSEINRLNILISDFENDLLSITHDKNEAIHSLQLRNKNLSDVIIEKDWKIESIENEKQILNKEINRRDIQLEVYKSIIDKLVKK